MSEKSDNKNKTVSQGSSATANSNGNNGNSVSSFDGFQLPSSVLKNLTPTKSPGHPRSPISPRDTQHYERRKSYLLARTHRLKERKSMIDERVLNVAQKRRLLKNKRLRNLNRSLEMASARRNEYLAAISKRAHNFQSRLVASDEPYDLCQESIFKENIRNTPNFEYEELEIRKLVLIQRRIKKYLLQKAVLLLENTSFLDQFMHMSFNECTKILQTDSVERSSMLTILRCLDIPDITYRQTYKTFFYAFILICDLNDSIKRNVHPTYNTNIEDEQQNMFNNFIWLLLFKIANLLISSFKDLLSSRDFHKPYAFIDNWNQYIFLFNIFKTNHLHNLRRILNQSLEIVSRQVEITNQDNEISKIKDNLTKEKLLLHKYRHTKVENRINVDELRFIELIKSSISQIQVPEIFYYRILTNQIIFENYKFSLPPVLSNKLWRRYWFLEYLKEFIENRQHPLLLRTGYIRPFSDNVLHIDEVLSSLGLTSVYEQFDILHGLPLIELQYRFVELLNKDFMVFVKFSKMNKEFNENHETFLEKYNQLADSWEDASSDLRTYLVEYFQILTDLTNSYRYTSLHEIPQICLARVLSSLELTMSTIHDVLHSYKEYKLLLINLWINKCKFKGFANFSMCENVMIFIFNNAALRFLIYTNSPQLKYPKFYEYLSSSGYSVKLSSYSSILEGAFDLPALMNENLNPKSVKFFSLVFRKSIVDGNLLGHELNDTYLHEFKRLGDIVANLIESTLTLNLILNFYNNVDTDQSIILLKPNEMIQKLLDRKDDLATIVNSCLTSGPYDNLRLQQFLKYHRHSLTSIRTILTQKFLNLLCADYGSANFNAILHSSFYYSREYATKVARDVHHTVYFVCKLHSPLLNWIYKDIGEPSEV
ncbi:uncharacterized protein PRCAT00002893001 [Priceomyces carsonii]|uniref:uncharacterized protein n=1 Tax=Priceomyces carsonii TaxID=28549 RepID=UPI002ED9E165|nr:unnamed protein product [Priceomyces carsonii]